MLDCKNIKGMLKAVSDVMIVNKNKLIEMDSIFGDGDLGLTMSDGFEAAYSAISGSEETDLGKLLYFAGKAMASKVPSTMGTLMATGLMSSGKALKGQVELDIKGLSLLLDSYITGVMKLGKAKRGEKTFVDGFIPAVDSMKESANSGLELKEAIKKASDASKEGYLQTKDMLAVHGRAAIRGEQSRMEYDPGAYVATLIVGAIADYINNVD